MAKRRIAATILALAITITATMGFSDESSEDTTSFVEVIATSAEKHLILFATVKDSFTQEMLSGLRSGIPVQFSFFVELYRKQDGNYKTQVARREFRHTMSYDTLKESYTVELGENNSKVLANKSLGEARALMSEINGFEVIELDKLIPDSTYRLRLRAELYEKTLPMGLHRVFPFLSWWDLETKWHPIEFNY